jgi:putative ABC transport system permease protein
MAGWSPDVDWLDRWSEVAQTLRRNRLRTALTALSVGWGVFMLVLLLGMGTGLHNNLTWQFRDDAINSIWLYPGQTALPYKGYAVGRPVRFTNADYDLLRQSVPGVERLTGRFYLWGELIIRAGGQTGAFSVRSCHPEHRYIEQTRVRSGRFLNELDITRRRKVAVIGLRVAEFLFPDRDPLEGPLGERISINSIPYRVVGVFEDVGSEGEMQQIYIPISTAQAAYGGGESIHQLMFTVGDASLEDSAAIAEDVLRRLAIRHNISPRDRRAIRVRNNLERFAELQQVLTWLSGFIWLVGIGTVTAGIVGVSNIMLISVQERTREIGLRKALGATPAVLITQIIREAVALTAVSGYSGLLLGVAVIEAMRRFIPENDYIRDPEVALTPALITTAMLVLSGALAGYFPARRAAAVPPVEALREDG